MAKELFNSDFYTLPEQVQINKDDIKTNTADIAKLKDDIGKIKPNAWEERKFNVSFESVQFECTTYNPVIDTNILVNAQKTFTDKDTYPVTESINSYSYSFSFNEQMLGNVFTYAICVDPSLTLNDIIQPYSLSKNGIILQNVIGSEEGAFDQCNIYINCKELTTEKIKIGDGYIEGISNTNDTSDTGIILSSSVINYNYLKKSTASDIYLSKTDASNTYVTKQDYNNRFEKAILTLTEAGFNKIKTMVENEGTTIILSATSDFTEQVPEIDPNNMKEIILYVKYGVESIYSNIHLVPNTTIGDYDNLQGSSDYWYTGHAMFLLPSQDNGYFVIAYQKGVQLILRLIMHY